MTGAQASESEQGNAPESFALAKPGTIYWTLSLFVDSDRVSAAAGQPGIPIRHDQFAALQATHLPSRVLRDAIEPLFNDIADREVLGEVQEHLISALADQAFEPGTSDVEQLRALEKAIRVPEVLTFIPPETVQWTTEGLTYQASPPNLGRPRIVHLRRFWVAHNNGALSYHLSFSHCYANDGAQTGYDAATYYFLSLLQKLGAPKEFVLENGRRASVFDENLGIAPLDELRIESSEKQTERFWPMVKQRMLEDAERLFDQLGKQTGQRRAQSLESHLIDLVPFIEVPGLTIPKSRFMFLLHDPRFFDRLMPLDRHTGTAAARKEMVQEPCYAPYQLEMQNKIKNARESGGIVNLDNTYWQWVTTRDDYAKWITGSDPVLRKVGGSPFASLDELSDAMHRGTAETISDEWGNRLSAAQVLRAPAFELQRPDCLDYLFLSGFNQNIIDFMNQDTSEILDSIDPIYPESNIQSDERFFVRYANHRGMTTYLPRSRSLETGNDYIGTCPYAFLIHVLALHNEFLARGHEARSLARIARIERLVGREQRPLPALLGDLVTRLDAEEPLVGRTSYDRSEMAINQAKFAEYKEYERYRYENPFRYDTERTVFSALEELRGTKRKKEALALAVATLEDHASDLQRRQQAAAAEASASRDKMISYLLGSTGVFGAGQMVYWIGETAAGNPEGEPKQPPEPIKLGFLGFPDQQIEGQVIMDATTALMFYALIGFASVGIVALCRWIWAKALGKNDGRV